MKLVIFLFSAFVSTILAPLVIRFYTRKKWLDDPGKTPHIKKTHKKPVPRGGGLVVFLGILVGSLLFLNLDQYLLYILLGATILTIVGILDDIFDIHPFIRLITGLIASILVIQTGIEIGYVSNPFGIGVLSLPDISFLNSLDSNIITSVFSLSGLATLLFIMWNMNILNWAKGVDGQLPGFVSVSAIFIGLLSFRFIDDPTTFNTSYLSFIVAGSYFGLLLWNWYPQKMMPGYGAGSLAGYFLSILAILSGAKLATTLMVLALPTADGIFTISRRILAGKSPFWGDRGHFHHKLMDVFGWGKRRIAIFYWLVSLFLGTLSLFLNTTGKIITFLLTVSFVFGFLIWTKWYSQKNKN
ncbi:MAG: undecaprenyl/decaprenyl-phosphate alpha-N-acetylglucosaminyl 1-phosphate transferase [Candidatus Pacebacteria bacterium]|jgi:UDP-GlcNAc:undecaprenyl-phosphate/decaprenyl-phosphate GlcNAc-1-phosphate transferase|nr:undecaprenyl/decaprenyl-phosphate alpha-N-acetylglucosaminyl 1-phosphate transferase [Candidatus Paceibacterota bacterium]MBT4652241.1 undecaprenyl/decaprenyl-phosphate alpha-N-acetylglucosaminyl 1-phosphate transferase [Candidatus Paceibacterota bacterium]MBT6756653.1 undecaprenyl/decaprenyl-phosphate alpha-N-acetylglucosaminyl 1-phosphate transferase [Candidatus Paceibacterota bacterium]MBT6921431.1 undecaprenyl/decaprenyl-phosphate alpha-N-acetylglucosaminyl 1-phosphate transferase [Candid